MATLQGGAVTLGERGQYHELPTQKQRWLEQAPGWVQDDQYNEPVAFDLMYDEIVSAYYEQVLDTDAQGRMVQRLFTKWKPMVEAFVQSVLHDSEIDDTLDAHLEWEPEGRGEAYIRPISEDTFSEAHYTVTPSGTGRYNWIPSEEDTATNGDSETMAAGEQGVIVIGYIETVAGGYTGYDQIQEDVDDGLGVRRELHTRGATEFPGTLGIIERNRGPVPVYPGESVDLDLNIYESGVKTGLWPVGAEVITADASSFGGVMD
jgi:hypothetical protein